MPREKANWNPNEVFVQGKYNNAEMWRDRDNKEFQPGQHYFVGGNTKLYGAVLMRMRREDFGEVRHHGGISPEWPLGYEDFEPYYARAEQLYQVHGQRGVDPTEPWASGPYPYPAVSHEMRIQQLSEDLRRTGHTPFPLPVGIMLDEETPHVSSCIRCETCDGFPCLVNAKADAHVVCVEPALQHDNVTLLTNAKVVRLETNPSGRVVTNVVVQREDERINYSAALLLGSASGQHPKGLGNSSDMVGRHYMAHNNSAMIAISKEPNPTRFQKTLGINDYYFGAADWEYPLGHIQMLGKSSTDMLKESAPRFVPGKALNELATHSLDFWLTSEDLPDPGNRISLNASGQIVLEYTDNNMEGHNRLVAKLRGMLNGIGCETHLFPHFIYMGKRIPIAGVAHQNGTLRFGVDPQDSVLDLNCKAHDQRQPLCG